MEVVPELVVYVAIDVIHLFLVFDDSLYFLVKYDVTTSNDMISITTQWNIYLPF